MCCRRAWGAEPSRPCRVGRGTLFESDGDQAAFERVLGETAARLPSVGVLAYCQMPNHWHLVLLPKQSAAHGALSEFLRLLTVTHTQRWHAAHGTAGTGPLYQGRFKSFPVKRDAHLLVACRYAERNPVRAGLVRRARDWRWGSAWHRHAPLDAAERADWLTPPHRWPVDVPDDFDAWVDRAETAGELDALRRSLMRGAPLGPDRWVKQTAARLGLESTLHPRGRPRKPGPQ